MLVSDLNIGTFLLGWFLLGLAVFAFADAVTRSDAAFRAASKMNKMFWLLVLGIAAAWDAFGPGGPFGFVGIAGLVATIVYIVDVRPAVRTYGGRSGRSGSSW
ncbi:MAG: DUF2516 family protein [Sporichthyaceae bacterium]|nr:DUF2516 family protein [Sporichthyaceae bacterium]